MQNVELPVKRPCRQCACRDSKQASEDHRTDYRSNAPPGFGRELPRRVAKEHQWRAGERTPCDGQTSHCRIPPKTDHHVGSELSHRLAEVCHSLDETAPFY